MKYRFCWYRQFHAVSGNASAVTGALYGTWYLVCLFGTFSASVTYTGPTLVFSAGKSDTCLLIRAVYFLLEFFCVYSSTFSSAVMGCYTRPFCSYMGTCSDVTVRAVPFPSEHSAPSGTSSAVMGTVFAVTDAFSAVICTLSDAAGTFFVVLKYSLRNERV